jgi:hypothetical protein
VVAGTITALVTAIGTLTGGILMGLAKYIQARGQADADRIRARAEMVRAQADAERARAGIAPLEAGKEVEK